MATSNVHAALLRIAEILDSASIPYAIAGAMALNQYGYRRATEDVDILIARDGLVALKKQVLGHGYVERFAGSKGMRDTVHGVPIDFLIAGDYPGDGLAKPVVFPDPAVVAIRGERASFLPLTTLLELKLASGMSAPHRLKDLADVLELIRTVSLAQTFVDQLHPFVQAKFTELWLAAQTVDDD